VRGELPPFEPEPLCMELVRRLPEYPGLSLEAVKPVFGRREIVCVLSEGNHVIPGPQLESVSVLSQPVKMHFLNPN
jgi:hypothetical protein